MSVGTGRGTASAVLTKIAAPTRYAIEMRSPVQDRLRGFIEENRQTDPLRMVQPNTNVGQTLAICGAGPSLRKHEIEGVDEVWACNSALPYLLGKGVKVDYGVGIDQTPGLLREWASAPDVPYLLASSCDPALVAHLKSAGRDIAFFHNAVGLEKELELYCETWPPGYMVGEGFMVTSRLVGLAWWMGFERVDLYGCDCALDGDVAHANGEVATEAYHNPLIMEGTTNGRTWRTRPDMLIGAVELVRRVQRSQGRIRLIGDTLPVALLGKSEDYLDQVARQIRPGDPIPEPS